MDVGSRQCYVSIPLVMLVVVKSKNVSEMSQVQKGTTHGDDVIISAFIS